MFYIRVVSPTPIAGLMNLSYILMYVIFCLHSCWESSPLPPDPPLRQNITCTTSSAVTAIGSFILFHLFHCWVIQKSLLKIQCWGLMVPYNTCHHEKALHRTCCGRLYTARERLTLCSPFCCAASNVANQQ